MITDDFDASEFLKYLDSDAPLDMKLSGTVAMLITLAEAFAKRGDISKYAVFEGVSAFMMLHIAVETRKEIALDAIKTMTQLVKNHQPESKH